MNPEAVSSSVIEQFNRGIAMFREAILAFPEDNWKMGETDYLRPVGVAYHVVETIQFYTGDLPADQFKWGGRFGVDWESPESGKLPSQPELLGYLDEVWSIARGWIASHDLTHAEEIFTWTGKTLLSRMGYVLRHTQHHTAEMALELTKRGYQAPDWK